jgi:hypothetical protein
MQKQIMDQSWFSFPLDIADILQSLTDFFHREVSVRWLRHIQFPNAECPWRRMGMNAFFLEEWG